MLCPASIKSLTKEQQMSTAAIQYEPVPTPTQFVGEVYALLARLMGTTAAEVAEGAVVAEEATEPVTTDEDLIRRIYNESHEPHRRLLKRLAESPDEWIFASQLAKDLELLGREQVARRDARGAWPAQQPPLRGKACLLQRVGPPRL